MEHQKIASVIQELEVIVGTCIQQRNPHGLFAALYLKVTRNIRDGIKQQHFEDNDRMENFDVIFARRYLDAYQAHLAGLPHSAAWQVAFAAINKEDALSIQHLLLGMNAHINLDLGIVAAEVTRGKPLNELEADFNRINDILIGLLDSVQQNINRISPAMWLIDWLFTRKDEEFAGFSMRAARTYAWRSAQLLHATPEKHWQEEIALLDNAAASLGRGILEPPGMLRKFIALVRRFEEKDVERQIREIEG